MNLPCQEKWEWPAAGQCLCLFDVDRTLTSRFAGKSAATCFGDDDNNNNNNNK